MSELERSTTSFLNKMSKLLPSKKSFLKKMYPNDLECDLVQECVNFQCNLFLPEEFNENQILMVPAKIEF